MRKLLVLYLVKRVQMLGDGLDEFNISLILLGNGGEVIETLLFGIDADGCMDAAVFYLDLGFIRSDFLVDEVVRVVA
jgi:hypothetical protein